MPVKRSCSIVSCKNTSNNSNATFFKPKNDIVAVRWRNLRPEEFSLDLPKFICSDHFFDNNIIVTNIGGRRLTSSLADPDLTPNRYIYCMFKKSCPFFNPILQVDKTHSTKYQY